MPLSEKKSGKYFALFAVLQCNERLLAERLAVLALVPCLGAATAGQEGPEYARRFIHVVRALGQLDLTVLVEPLHRQQCRWLGLLPSLRIVFQYVMSDTVHRATDSPPCESVSKRVPRAARAPGGAAMSQDARHSHSNALVAVRIPGGIPSPLPRLGDERSG